MSGPRKLGQSARFPTGRTLIATVVAANNQNVHFDGTQITGEYDDYEIDINGVALSSTDTLYIQLSSDGVTWITASVYSYIIQNAVTPVSGASPTSAVAGAVGQAFAVLNFGLPTPAQAGRSYNGSLHIRNVNSILDDKVVTTESSYLDSTGNIVRGVSTIYCTMSPAQGALRGINFLTGGVDTMMRGTFRLYGLNK